MENIPRNLEKDIIRLTSPTPSKRKKKWTLLAIGNNGKIIRVGMLKPLILVSIILIISGAAAALTFYMLYQNIKEENYRLEKKLADSEEKVASLGKEIKHLMANKLWAESKLQKHLAKTQIPKPPTLPEEVAEAKELTEIRSEAVIINETETEKSEEPPSDSQAEETAPVEIEDLAVSFDSYTDKVKVYFIIKKTDPNLASVSGRTLVVLKPDTVNQENWVSLPSIKLKNGLPSRTDKGRLFSISRFKPITLETTGLNLSVPYTHATIYVFTREGKQLLEKSFPIKMKPAD